MARITNSNTTREPWLLSPVLPISSFLFIDYFRYLFECNFKTEETTTKGLGTVSLRFAKNRLILAIELFDLNNPGSSSNPTKIDALPILLFFRMLVAAPLLPGVVFGFACSIKPVTEITVLAIISYFKLRISQQSAPLEVIAALHKLLSTAVGLAGYRIEITGRYARQQRAAKLIVKKGVISLSSLHCPITFSDDFLLMKHGKCGLKVWINKVASFSSNTIFYSVVP